MDNSYLNSIRGFEGYTVHAKWDYNQHTNGFGTKALFPGEKIERAEAERRFKAEITKAEQLVDDFAPGLDDGTRAALTSLTFNAGTTWMKSQLGQAIQRGDLEAAKSRFVLYNKAGGAVLPGLEARRNSEVEWFGRNAATSTHIASSDNASANGAVTKSLGTEHPEIRTGSRTNTGRIPSVGQSGHAAPASGAPDAFETDRLEQIAAVAGTLQSMDHFAHAIAITSLQKSRIAMRTIERAHVEDRNVATPNPQDRLKDGTNAAERHHAPHQHPTALAQATANASVAETLAGAVRYPV